MRQLVVVGAAQAAATGPAASFVGREPSTATTDMTAGCTVVGTKSWRAHCDHQETSPSLGRLKRNGPLTGAISMSGFARDDGSGEIRLIAG